MPERAALKDATDTAAPLRSLGTTKATEMAWIFSQLAEHVLTIGAAR